MQLARLIEVRGWTCMQADEDAVKMLRHARRDALLLLAPPTTTPAASDATAAATAAATATPPSTSAAPAATAELLRRRRLVVVDAVLPELITPAAAHGGGDDDGPTVTNAIATAEAGVVQSLEFDMGMMVGWGLDVVGKAVGGRAVRMGDERGDRTWTGLHRNTSTLLLAARALPCDMSS
jgi:hypothetical protein